MRRILFYLFLCFVLVVGGLFTYRRLHKKPGVKVLETAKVQQGNIRGVLVATGIIKPQVGASVKIGARATGNIVKINVKVGDRVKKGQLIALIDDREIRQNIEQQQAGLVSAENTLRQVELTYPERIKEAGANYDYAKLTFDRHQNLIAKGSIAKDTLDKSRSQLEAAQAVLKRLKDEFATQLAISDANIKAIKAQIEQLQTRLSYTKIYSPMDGIVSEVTGQEGETVVTGLQVANLVTVIDPARLEMQIYIDETDIGKIQPGQAVEYSVDTFPGKTFGGEINNIYPEPTIKDNIVYYLAIVKVPTDYTGFLKTEMTTHVKIITQEKSSVTTVSNAAIKFEKGRQVAYRVVGPNKVEKAELKIGVRGEDKTEVLSGLKEGDEVATRIIMPVEKKSPNER